MTPRSENPFNYDLNDLGMPLLLVFTPPLTTFLADLDSFCLAIQRELHEITAVSTTSYPFAHRLTLSE